MKVLVINSGSSSLKFQLFDMENDSVIAKGLCERIGLDGLLSYSTLGKEKQQIAVEMKNHTIAMQIVIDYLVSAQYGVIDSIHEIDAVGHRIGHGGEYIPKPMIVDQSVKDAVEKCIVLAPLHNPSSLMCIQACEALLGTATPQVVVCDTAFHQTMPPKAYTYGLPLHLREKYHIRKYGFHGTSHKYVAGQTAALLNRDVSDINIISCHLGNGSSVTAIEKGKSVDTSMGFTGMAGVMMGTRCGDVDPALLPYIMIAENMSAKQLDEMIYNKSGMLAISGISSDLRDIEEAASAGHEQAKLALETLCHQIKRFIGAYIAVLNGVDAIVFTAGIGENSPIVRSGSLSNLENLGIVLDEDKNRACKGVAGIISAPASAIPVVVMPTNEEFVIAQETMLLVETKNGSPKIYVNQKVR